MLGECFQATIAKCVTDSGLPQILSLTFSFERIRTHISLPIELDSAGTATIIAGKESRFVLLRTSTDDE
jgi:hypothetical protein